MLAKEGPVLENTNLFCPVLVLLYHILRSIRVMRLTFFFRVASLASLGNRAIVPHRTDQVALKDMGKYTCLKP